MRTSILSENALTVFKIETLMNEVDLYYLENGIFNIPEHDTKLLSAVADSLIVFERDSDKARQCIEVKQSSLKRCNILIRVWRIRFRIVITVADGLIVFPMSAELRVINERIQMPNEDNTIAIIGMKPKVRSFYPKITVFANGDGNMENFNGSEAHLGIDLSLPNRFEISKELISDPEKRLSFNIKLYKSEPKPMGSFKAQRTSAPW